MGKQTANDLQAWLGGNRHRPRPAGL